KGIGALQANKVTAIAQRNFPFERKFGKQYFTELCSRSRFTNDKGSRSAHIYNIVVAQFSRDNAWAKPSVSANIHTPQENNQSHRIVLPQRPEPRLPAVRILLRHLRKPTHKAGVRRMHNQASLP